MDAKLNLSYQDYKVSKADFFNGCPTMVTSEKAALAKAHAIYDNHRFKQAQGQKVGKYVDPDFGPRRKTDVEGSSLSMYKTGTVPRKGYAEPREVDWVFAEALCQPG